MQKFSISIRHFNIENQGIICYYNCKNIENLCQTLRLKKRNGDFYEKNLSFYIVF